MNFAGWVGEGYKKQISGGYNLLFPLGYENLFMLKFSEIILSFY